MGRPFRKLTPEEIKSVQLNPPKVMNTAQVGAYIGLSTTAVRYIISIDETFPAFKLSVGGEWKFLLVKVDAWLLKKDRVEHEEE